MFKARMMTMNINLWFKTTSKSWQLSRAANPAWHPSLFSHAAGHKTNKAAKRHEALPACLLWFSGPVSLLHSSLPPPALCCFLSKGQNASKNVNDDTHTPPIPIHFFSQGSQTFIFFCPQAEWICMYLCVHICDGGWGVWMKPVYFINLYL